MNRMIRLAVLVLALLPALAFAQQQSTTTQYPEWDQLSQAQRDAIIAPLRERWNANPGERATMVERANRWQAMPRDQRDRARHGMQRWEHMSPEKRNEARALYHAMRGMDKERREAFLSDWRKKSPQQKAEWLKAHPAPERHAKPQRD